MEVKVLGEDYTVDLVKRSDDLRLNDIDGYCDTSEKLCVIDDMSEAEHERDAKGDLKSYRKQVIRHELLHAFLFESGLDVSSWAASEEIIDWIAIQFPKIVKAFNDAKCL